MTTLIIPDNPSNAESPRLDISIGESIDRKSSQEDAVVEFAAFDHLGEHIPMSAYGYTLDIHEATALRNLLNTAIEKAAANKEE